MSSVLIDMGEDPSHKSSIKDDFMYNNNVAQANINIRLGFLRKVYGILSVQLMVTVITASICMFNAPIRLYVYNNPWMALVAMVSSIALLFAMMVKRREAPINFILLMMFTLVQAYSVSIVVVHYDQIIVLQAAILTLAVSIALTAYTFQSKRDFSAWGAGLSSVLIILIFTGLLQMFFWNTYMELACSVLGAVVFSLFIIYDTHMLIHRLSPEEYIIASIELYLDIINLFLYILKILNSSKKN